MTICLHQRVCWCVSVCLFLVLCVSVSALFPPCRSICTGWQSSWQLVRGCVGGLGERLGSHDSDHRLHDGSNPCRLAARPQPSSSAPGGGTSLGNIGSFEWGKVILEYSSPSSLVKRACGDIFANDITFLVHLQKI